MLFWRNDEQKREKHGNADLLLAGRRDLASGHALGIEAESLVVHGGKAGLVLFDQYNRNELTHRVFTRSFSREPFPLVLYQSFKLG